MTKYEEFKKYDNYVLSTSKNDKVDARTVHAVEFEGEFYIMTNLISNKANEISANNNVCLSHLHMEGPFFDERRVQAKLEKVDTFTYETYKEVYLAKYPYMAGNVDHVIAPFENKVVYKVIPSEIRITTPLEDTVEKLAN